MYTIFSISYLHVLRKTAEGITNHFQFSEQDQEVNLPHFFEQNLTQINLNKLIYTGDMIIL